MFFLFSRRVFVFIRCYFKILYESKEYIMNRVFLFFKKYLLLLSLWVCGREASECGHSVGNMVFMLSIECPHVPKGTGCSEGLVHISIGFESIKKHKITLYVMLFYSYFFLSGGVGSRPFL